jgi:hypothetical protein
MWVGHKGDTIVCYVIEQIYLKSSICEQPVIDDENRVSSAGRDYFERLLVVSILSAGLLSFCSFSKTLVAC